MVQTAPLHHEPGDRRTAHRFPVEAELRYRFLNGNTIEPARHGRIVNISSSGALIRCRQSIPPGHQIELLIAWPAPMDGVMEMHLLASGRTVRDQGNCTGIRIIRYEFKSGSLRNQPVRISACALA